MDSGLLKHPFFLPGLCAVAIFANILGADFVYDDITLIKENPFMDSWASITEAFRLPYWRITGDERNWTSYYRPIGGALLVILNQIGGGSPAPFHATSLLLHLACTLLVTGLALQLQWPRRVAIAAGTLFALHGVHVEAVAWISALPDLLATFFGLLALRAWLRPHYFKAAFWLGLAMLSKEAAIGVAFLFLFDTLRQARQRWLLQLAPCAVAALLVWTLRAWAFESPWAGLNISGTQFGLSTLHLTLISFGLIFQSIAFLLWPWPHAPFPTIRVAATPMDFEIWGPALGGGILLFGAAFVWWKHGKSNPLVRVAIGLLFFSLLPVLNTKLLGAYPFQERYLYLASAGFSLLLAHFFFGRRAPGHATTLIFTLLLVLNGTSTLANTPKWSTEKVFFNWACEASPESMTSWMGAARVHLEKAQVSIPSTSTRIQESLTALQLYQKALAVNSAEWMVLRVDREGANSGQGDALFLAGDFEQAEMVYKTTLKGYPESPYARIGYANCLTRRGEIHGQEGNRVKAEELWEKALTYYSKAEELRRTLIVAVQGQGMCLAFLGRYEEALPFLERAFQHSPENAEFARSLAEVHASLGRFHFARQALEQHLRVFPESPMAFDFREAIEELRKQTP